MSNLNTGRVVILTFADDLFFRDDLARFELRNKFINGMLSDKIGNDEKFLSQVISNAHLHEGIEPQNYHRGLDAYLSS